MSRCLYCQMILIWFVFDIVFLHFVTTEMLMVVESLGELLSLSAQPACCNRSTLSSILSSSTHPSIPSPTRAAARR